MSDAVSRLIELPDGVRLRAEARGTGPVVLCCHGGPGLWDYLGALASLLEPEVTVVRFDQRGCGRSSGTDGPFTIDRALDDLDRVRAAYGTERCAVIGHSWGAELALRYAARYPEQVSGVGYLGGIGAGNGFRAGYVAERNRRLGADLPRWEQLGTSTRTPAEEREFCLLQWRPDFSPAGDPVGGAQALWATRPPGVEVNARANRELWADRETEDLLELAASVAVPVEMVLGEDDPRPWQATDALFAALPRVRREVLAGAGHAPWVERPDAVRAVLLDLIAG